MMHQRRRNLATEWTLGLLCPLLVAGSIYQSSEAVILVLYAHSAHRLCGGGCSFHDL